MSRLRLKKRKYSETLVKEPFKKFLEHVSYTPPQKKKIGRREMRKKLNFSGPCFLFTPSAHLLILKYGGENLRLKSGLSYTIKACSRG